MGNLTRETLPTPEQRRPLVPVEMPAWDGTLYVRALPSGAVVRLPDDPAQRIGEMLVKSTCFADGGQVWADNELETVLAYPEEDLKPLLRAVLKVNGIDDKSLEERKGN